MKRRALAVFLGLFVTLVAGVIVYWQIPCGVCSPTGLAAYHNPTRDARANGEVKRVVYLDQGWTPAESADFYTHSQGSRLLPYPWFLALEQAGSTTPFRDPDNMARLGFLNQRPTAWNPDALPVGFARDPDSRGDTGDWLGFTCAACHTTEIRYRDTAYRIDGGPALADVQTFLADLTAALQATNDDAAKFDRFAGRVLPGGSRSERRKLKERFAETVRTRTEYEELNRTPHAYGHARLDAFGRIVNQILVVGLEVTDQGQKQSPDAPVSYPFLWDTPHHDFVQWNGVARNRPVESDSLGGLGRNVGEVLGVFGELEIPRPRRATVFTGYESSARIPDLIHLEQLVRKLQSPLWPADFPPVDPVKRDAGQKVYDRYCASCHEVIDRTDPARGVTAVLTPIKRVGTDPRMATNFADRRGKTGRLKGRKAYFVSGDQFGNEAGADEIVAHTVVGVILGSPWKNYKDTDLSSIRRQPQTDRNRDALLVYKARPLNGVWATAPYLHNGSVPSLYHLLLPAGQRPPEFVVGSPEFDPETVGFRSDRASGGSDFRVRDATGAEIPGNSNRGHEYGTGKAKADGGDGLPALTDEQRLELLEYLKSL